MIDELNFAPQDWTRFIQSIASNLNESTPDRIGYQTDVIAHRLPEIRTGIYPKRSVLRILPWYPNFIYKNTIEHARIAQVIALSELQAELDQVRKQVANFVNLRSNFTIE